VVTTNTKGGLMMAVYWAWVFFIAEWAVRLVMLFYVPQKRSPAAARTWLLLIFIEPFLGLLLYALLGRAYMPKRRLELQEAASKLIKSKSHRLEAHIRRPDLPPEFLPAVRLAENLGDFPILGGNHVELLPDYEAAVDRLIADIRAACRHANLLYYLFADDKTGNRVADALVEAVQRGVTCRLLLDSFASRRALRTVGPRLRAAGVEVVALLPLGFFGRKATRLDLRNHRKIAVLDGRIAHVGSQNIVDADFKPGVVYEELGARVIGPVVHELQAVLLADRYYETETEATEEEERLSTPDHPGNMEAQTLPSGPGYPFENNLRLVVSLLYAARMRVVMTTPYFVPDDTLLQAMTTAARRGVEVHLVVSAKADQLLVGLAQRSYYEELLVAGVRIHVYQKRFLHAKHLSIDDKVALIGSTNMDMRSFALQCEVSLLVYNEQAVKALHGVQQRYFDGSTVLTLEEWRRRPTLVCLLQNLARLVDAVL
jgi:cardiolipin synthase A/B